MQKWVNIFTFACMVRAEGADPPHPSPFPTYGPVKRPFFTTSLWLNRWVFFMRFLPHFLESLNAPILSERSRISLNHISNINTIPRLKWISHNIRIIELFALYKCIPHPLPASWSHLMEQIYQWNIFIWGFVFLTLICFWGFFYLMIFVCYLDMFLKMPVGLLPT